VFCPCPLQGSVGWWSSAGRRACSAGRVQMIAAESHEVRLPFSAQWAEGVRTLGSSGSTVRQLNRSQFRLTVAFAPHNSPSLSRPISGVSSTGYRNGVADSPVFA